MTEEIQQFLEEFTDSSKYDLSSYDSDGYYSSHNCPFCGLTDELDSLIDHNEDCLFLRATLFLHPEISLAALHKERADRMVKEAAEHKAWREQQDRRTFEELKKKFGEY